MKEMSIKTDFLLHALKSEQTHSAVNEERRVTNLQTTPSNSSSPDIPQVDLSEIEFVHNRRKEYYKYTLQSTLQRGWCVSENYGRIHSSGTIKVQDFDSEDEATQYLNKLADKLRRDGFQKIEPQPTSTLRQRKGGRQLGIPDIDEEDENDEDNDDEIQKKKIRRINDPKEEK